MKIDFKSKCLLHFYSYFILLETKVLDLGTFVMWFVLFLILSIVSFRNSGSTIFELKGSEFTFV